MDFETDEARERLDKLQKLEEIERMNDLKKILKLPYGRRFVWDLLSKGGVFKSSFSDSDRQTNFNEGRRLVGLGLLHDVMKANPDAFTQMQQEHIANVKQRQKELEEVTDGR